LNALLESLDEYGLSGHSQQELSDLIYQLGKRKLDTWSERLVETSSVPADVAKPDPLDVFNFLASSAIRGATSCVYCQTAQLDKLARFAALYADRLVLPANFAVSGYDRLSRLGLIRAVNAVNSLRPLIEAGIVQVKVAATCLCRDCLRKRGVPFERIDSEAKAFWRKRISDFQVVYHSAAGRKCPRLVITGPDAFMPHDRFVVQFRETPSFASRLNGGAVGSGVVVPESIVAEEDLLAMAYSEFAGDLMAQQLYGVQFGTTYLTDLPGQAEFFGQMKARNERMANAARLCSHLAHSVPLLSDVPINEVLKIRSREPEAFLRYRSTLNRIVQEHVRPGAFLGTEDASLLYHDVLRPQLARLKSEVLARRKTSQRKALAKIGCSFAAITLGVVNGLLPAELAKLFTAVGGVSLLKDIGEAVADIQRKPNEVRNNDLYFLLELEERIPHE
jgi:hypothetical protein